MSEKVITRFAPSPTGYLHIGGARTALFNWLYAKHTGGKMLLRIEDTDQARSTEGAILAILDGLRWLELDWDGEPVYQLTRAERHREIAEQLLAQGNAYRCYASPEELQAMRERARAEGRAPGYDGTWRHRDPSAAPAGIEPAIRFKAPREGETVIEDRVQGRVVFANKDLDDLVILRSDGTPTYNLSVVVDDHDMGITHVIRGDDHLTNAARQTQIFKALGWTTPIYAHVPLIHGPDGAKLSKRHGALGVDAYRAMGYLPAALRNYLVRLGWSHGDAEIMSTEEMIKWFDLDAIGRSAARFDFAKLENLNGHYLRATPDAEIVERLKALVPELPDGAALGARIGDDGWQKLERAMPGLKERAKHSGRAARQRRLSLRHAPACRSMRWRARFWTKAAARRLRRSRRGLKRSSPGRKRRSRPRCGNSPTRRATSSARWPSRSERRLPAGRHRRVSSMCSTCSGARNRLPVSRDQVHAGKTLLNF